jgi:hypothetical protein
MDCGGLHHRRFLESRNFLKGKLWLNRVDNIYKELGE